MKEITKHGIRYEYNEETNVLTSKALNITITNVPNDKWCDTSIFFVEVLIMCDRLDLCFDEVNERKLKMNKFIYYSNLVRNKKISSYLK